MSTGETIGVVALIGLGLYAVAQSKKDDFDADQVTADPKTVNVGSGITVPAKEQSTLDPEYLLLRGHDDKGNNVTYRVRFDSLSIYERDQIAKNNYTVENGTLKVGVGHETTDEPKDIDIPNLKNSKLVFLDMVLNGQSGYDILLQIKDHYPKLPIVIVTAHRAEVGDIINASLEVGAYACLYKPLQIDEMFNAVNQIRFEELRHNLKSNLIGDGLE